MSVLPDAQGIIVQQDDISRPSDAASIRTERLLFEEWQLLNDPIALKGGIVLMSEDNSTIGKLVTRLSELPERKAFLTPLGNRLERINSTEIKFGDTQLIQISLTEPTLKKDTNQTAQHEEEELEETDKVGLHFTSLHGSSRGSLLSSCLTDANPNSARNDLLSSHISVSTASKTLGLSPSTPAKLSSLSNAAKRGRPRSVSQSDFPLIIEAHSTSVASSSGLHTALPASHYSLRGDSSTTIHRTSSDPDARKSFAKNSANASSTPTDQTSSKGQKSRLGALDLSTARIIQSIKSAVMPHHTTANTPPHRPPQLLPGESELFVCHDVEYVVSDKLIHPGSIFLTNYQILFRSSDCRQSIREVSLAPLGKITRIEKVGGKKSSILSSSLTRQLVIYCKDFHKSIVIRMASANAGQRKQLFELINKRAFPGQLTKLFAFCYTPPWSQPAKSLSPSLATLLRSDVNIGVNGWHLFSFEAEFKRFGVFEKTIASTGNPAWRWSDVNVGYALCKSYPERLVVPNEISDQQLQKVAQFRTQSRIPILSWLHKNGASITRCSQPKSGLVTARCSEDELLLTMIRETTESDQYPLVIIDPRPRTNAEANRAVGAGYEKEANYFKTKVHFMGIGNIHVVRDSQQTLAGLCAQISSRTDAIWLSGVEGTGWLKHIKAILSAATLITKCVYQHGASCLVHCSDGWDRTSQVVSLAMLLMDPFYRTISGFCILIEKEWIRAGHMFATRHGHGSKNYNEDSRAPIFLQWIDCVWQVFRQFITSFEFNENFLIRIVEEVCNCRFGTFLGDNEAAQKELGLAQNSVSLWTYIHHKDNFYRFINPLYSPPLASSTLGSKSPVMLLPKTSIFALSFWSNSYLQGSNFRDRIVEMSMERAFEMNCKLEDLEVRIAELERENALLRGDSPSPSCRSHQNGASLLKESSQCSVYPESVPNATSSSCSSTTNEASYVSPGTSSSSNTHDLQTTTIAPETCKTDVSAGVPITEGAAVSNNGQDARNSGDVALDMLVHNLAQVGVNRTCAIIPNVTSSSSSLSASCLPATTSVLPPPSCATPEPAISVEASLEPISAAAAPNALLLYTEEDPDLREALSMDTPRVRGIPQWGAVGMMIEDYTVTPKLDKK